MIHAWAPWVWGTTKSALYKYTYLPYNKTSHKTCHFKHLLFTRLRHFVAVILSAVYKLSYLLIKIKALITYKKKLQQKLKQCTAYQASHCKISFAVKFQEICRKIFYYQLITKVHKYNFKAYCLMFLWLYTLMRLTRAGWPHPGWPCNGYLKMFSFTTDRHVPS